MQRLSHLAPRHLFIQVLRMSLTVCVHLTIWLGAGKIITSTAKVAVKQTSQSSRFLWAYKHMLYTITTLQLQSHGAYQGHYSRSCLSVVDETDL